MKGSEIHVDQNVLLVGTPKIDACPHKLWCRYRSESAFTIQSTMHRLLDTPKKDACTIQYKKHFSGRTWRAKAIRMSGTVHRARVIASGRSANDACGCSPQPNLSNILQWIPSAQCAKQRTETWSSDLWRNDTRRWLKQSLRQWRQLRMLRMCSSITKSFCTVYLII